MKIRNLFQILPTYGKFLPQILFFEIYYLLKGYQKSSVRILNKSYKFDSSKQVLNFLKQKKNEISKN